MLKLEVKQGRTTEAFARQLYNPAWVKMCVISQSAGFEPALPEGI